MLKKVLLLAVTIGVSMAITPMMSIAAVKQSTAQTQAILLDDTVTDPANSNSYDSTMPSDDDSATTNEDDNGNDDAISSDATE